MDAPGSFAAGKEPLHPGTAAVIHPDPSIGRMEKGSNGNGVLFNMYIVFPEQPVRIIPYIAAFILQDIRAVADQTP